MSVNNNGVIQTIERKSEIVQSQPERHSLLRKAAEQLSRRNADQAVVELFMEALSRLVDLCYEQDADGFCNVDPVTNRILIPLPFGRAGYAKWGIRAQEANILRALLMARQRQPGLFLYDKSRRCWRVNLYDFGTRDLAVNYLAKCPITTTEFRAARVKVVSRS